MYSLFRLLVLWVCFAACVASISPSFAQAASDKRAKEIENEKTKLNKQTNPEDRTGSFTKIATITLTFVNDAIAANDAPGLASSVDEYRQALTSARDTMMESGRDAYKKPKGYQVIEFATRSHLRILEDLARRLPLSERKSIEEVIEHVSKIREEIVRVLFP